MSQTLENILSRICKNVEKLRSNEHQTVYQLQNASDAKLAYELVSSYGVEVKFFSEDATSGKIYVENASLANAESELQSAIAYADLFRKFKDVIDSSNGLDYTLTFSQSLVDARLTLQLSKDKYATKAHGAVSHANNHSQPMSPNPLRAKKMAKKSQADTLLAGPAVARQVLPKSMQSQSGTEEDPLFKRLFLHLTGRAFTSGSILLGIIVTLGIIFSVMVTVKGFLCPDFVTDQQKNPSYCPKPKSAEQRALEQK